MLFFFEQNTLTDTLLPSWEKTICLITAVLSAILLVANLKSKNPNVAATEIAKIATPVGPYLANLDKLLFGIVDFYFLNVKIFP